MPWTIKIAADICATPKNINQGLPLIDPHPENLPKGVLRPKYLLGASRCTALVWCKIMISLWLEVTEGTHTHLFALHFLLFVFMSHDTTPCMHIIYQRVIAVKAFHGLIEVPSKMFHRGRSSILCTGPEFFVTR